MIIREGRDDAHAILNHPAIYPVVTDDNSPEKVELPDHFSTLTAYVDGEPIGCLVTHWETSTTLQVHIQILPEHRKRHAMKAAQAFRQWLWDNTPAHKITAHIGACYPNVIKFAAAIGFEVEGVNKESLLKDGFYHDQIIMGLKRWQQAQQSQAA